MPISTPLPGPEQALLLSMPNILFIFPKYCSVVHFSVFVQEWPHHYSYEFGQTFQQNKIVDI